MSARQVRPRHSSCLVGATLALGALAISGCGSAAGKGMGGPDGGGGSAGTAGAGAGGAGAGTTGAGGSAGGASAGTTGAGGGAGASPRGGAGGGARGGAGGGAGSGGATGTGGQAGSPSCANAPHVLPLNPNNAQDGITLGGFYVDTDTWNVAGYTVSQTMYVCDYNNWYVVAKMDNSKGDGAVKTYPNVHKDFNAAPAISSFNAISSSFAHAGPHLGIYEFAYDIWLNGVAGPGSTEVMVWTDNFNQVPSGTVQETVTFGGQSFKVYKSGSYIAFVDTNNVTSGTVDLLAIFNHIIAKGWISSDATLGAIDYGVELVSTDGTDATFAVSGFSLTAN